VGWAAIGGTGGTNIGASGGARPRDIELAGTSRELALDLVLVRCNILSAKELARLSVPDFFGDMDGQPIPELIDWTSFARSAGGVTTGEESSDDISDEVDKLGRG
jgi:hypothetical protein